MRRRRASSRARPRAARRPTPLPFDAPRTCFIDRPFSDGSGAVRGDDRERQILESALGEQRRHLPLDPSPTSRGSFRRAPIACLPAFERPRRKADAERSSPRCRRTDRPARRCRAAARRRSCASAFALVPQRLGLSTFRCEICTGRRSPRRSDRLGDGLFERGPLVAHVRGVEAAGVGRRLARAR